MLFINFGPYQENLRSLGIRPINVVILYYIWLVIGLFNDDDDDDDVSVVMRHEVFTVRCKYYAWEM
jgi:hypothetical protein